MTLTINLTQDEETRLASEAQRSGVGVQELVRRIVIGHVPAERLPASNPDPTMLLFTQWELEDATRSHEEVENDERLWEEFERGINGARRDLGMREL